MMRSAHSVEFSGVYYPESAHSIAFHIQTRRQQLLSSLLRGRLHPDKFAIYIKKPFPVPSSERGINKRVLHGHVCESALNFDPFLK